MLLEMKLSSYAADFLAQIEMSAEAFQEFTRESPKKALFLLTEFRRLQIADYGEEWSGSEWADANIKKIRAFAGKETEEKVTLNLAPAVIEAEEKPESAPLTEEKPKFEEIPVEVMGEDEPFPTHEPETEKLPACALDKIIGQKIAVERLKSDVLSAREGREVPSKLLKGEPGLGKTALANAFLADMERFGGWETMVISSPKEVRMKGSAWGDLLDAITQSDRKIVILIDEAHELMEGVTVQLAKLRSILMKFMDGNNRGRYIKIDDETGVTVDPTRLAFVLSTNFPDKLDKSGAFQSRCQNVELDHYDKPELIAILQQMLGKARFREADENTLMMIAKCGRGTARTMEKIVQELRSFVTKPSINKDDVKNALRRCKLYPEGFCQAEIEMLKRISQPMRDNVLLAAFPNMEVTTLRRAKGHMMAVGLAAQVTGGFQRADKGTRYLKECKEQGFAI